MASWNLPDLASKIATDIPAIRQLLQALRVWGGTHDDEPEGAKKLVDVVQNTVRIGCQFQQLDSGGTWGSVGKLMHDVDTVDGFHASQGADAGTVAVRDSNGDLPGKAAQAGEALSLATSYTVPVNRGGTGANTAQGARANIGADNAGNITSGILAVAQGGTGNSNGFSPDVATSYSYLGQNNSAAPTSAKATGQLGLSALRTSIDCDSHRFPGRYICTGATIALHYPCTGSVAVDVIAGKAGSANDSAVVIIQRAYSPDGMQAWRRVSTNAGASWSGWHPEDYAGSSATIYIVGNGDDANYGLDSTHPVKTVARALEIAKELKVHGTLTLRFGAGSGSWGNVTIRGTALPCNAVCITNFANSNTTTKAAFDALTDVPLFGTLALEQGRFILGNVKANAVAFNGAFVESTKWMQAGRFYAVNGYLNVSSGMTVVKQESDGTSPLFDLAGSVLRIGNVAFTFSGGPLNSSFVSVSDGADVYVHTSFTSSGTFAAKKFAFSGTANVRGKAPTEWPGAAAGTGEYIVAGVPTNAKQVLQTPSGTSWVAGVKEGGALVGSQASSFGAVCNAKTKNHRIALATYPGSNDLVYLYSVTNANANANTNTQKRALTWNADTGELVAAKFTGPLNGNANSATKATQDKNGLQIDTNYAKLSGATFTGAVAFTRTTDAQGTGTNIPAVRIGDLTGAHLEFDGNEIMAKSSANATGPLYINGDGGAVHCEGKRVAKGASVGSGTKHVYSDSNGVLQPSSANVGNANQPMYLKAGVMTPCNAFGTVSMAPSGTTNGRSINTEYTADKNGWVRCWGHIIVVIAGRSYDNDYWHYTSHQNKAMIFPVAKGQKYKLTKGDGIQWIPAS